jgi:type VI secretion system secreted protein VgrG
MSAQPTLTTSHGTLFSATLHSERHAPSDFTVLSFSGTEGVNDPHAFTITVRCGSEEDARAAQEETLIGHGAVLTIQPNGVARKIRGHVRRVTFVEVLVDRTAVIEVELVSRLWLLTQRTQSRIFQDKTVPQIVDAICAEWQIERTWRLRRTYRSFPYVTQYNETDYDFLCRVLAKEGIFFFSGEPSDDSVFGDAVVLQDEADDYPIMLDEHGDSPKEPPTMVRWDLATGTVDMGVEEIFDLTAVSRVRPKSVRLLDYDFRKPALTLTGKFDLEPSNEQKREKKKDAPAPQRDTSKLQFAMFADTHESDADAAYVEFTDAVAGVTLDQARRDTQTLTGTTNSWRVRPGRVLAIDDRRSPLLSGAYVPIRLEHEAGLKNTRDVHRADYRSTFVCIAATRCFRPSRSVPPLRAVSETATVIGDGDEIVTDAFGRVKVRFHWSSGSSCWLRVSQPWAGVASGAQFIPRVGSEVLVTFLGGDMDRPLVVGSLYNGTHPLPFNTPRERTRSGFKTKTSGGDGYNELSFDDEAGKEELRLRAQRNLTEVVLRDHSSTVERNQTLVVRGEQEIRVGALSSFVGGASVHVTTGEHQHTIGGGLTQSVGGNGDLRIAGTMTQHSKRKFEEIEGASTTSVKSDHLLRVKGHALTIVGEHDHPTSWVQYVEGSSNSYSVGVTEIVSEVAIELRCGESSIRLTPDAIELYTPKLLLHAGETVEIAADDTMKILAKNAQTLAAKKIQIQADSAGVSLAQIAKIDGTLIKLNCGPDSADEVLPKYEPPVPTKFKLVDQEGKPLANQRFRLLMGDGTERSGFLDADGSAELLLEGSGQIVFPDVDNPRKS